MFSVSISFILQIVCVSVFIACNIQIVSVHIACNIQIFYVLEIGIKPYSNDQICLDSLQLRVQLGMGSC